MDMKKIWYILMALALVIAGSVQAMKEEAPFDPQGRAERISAQAAVEQMEALEEYVLLDVRTAEEYEAGHIQGALLIPEQELAAKAPEMLPDLETPIFVYCRSGRRSALAAQALVDLGYLQVYDFGGINDWPHGLVKD